MTQWNHRAPFILRSLLTEVVRLWPCRR